MSVTLHPNPPIFGICGDKGQGKTTAVISLAGELERSGVRVAGVAQPARLRGGRVVGYDLLDLESGKKRTLARRSERGEQPGFAFDPAAFEWAGRRIDREADVVLVDEIGWVEIEGRGHMPAFSKSLQRAAVKAAVIGVRRDYIGALRDLVGPIHPWPLGSTGELESRLERWQGKLKEIIG
jgi:nucleoside-triphosphatase THEP1